MKYTPQEINDFVSNALFIKVSYGYSKFDISALAQIRIRKDKKVYEVSLNYSYETFYYTTKKLIRTNSKQQALIEAAKFYFGELRKDLFHNSALHFELERLISYDVPVITTDFDANLDGLKYIIDVNDNGYFYVMEEERDEDFELLKRMLQKNDK